MNPKRLAAAGILTVLMGCRAENDPVHPPAPSSPAGAAALPESPYLGQPVPGLTPERFAPGLVSTPAIELNSVFSPDQREFYFTRVVDGVDTMYQIAFADVFPGEANA
jgi:hypothetical protein